jgi:hypothetical protein
VAARWLLLQKIVEIAGAIITKTEERRTADR